MESPSYRLVIQFGVFEVDTVAGELRKNGVKVRIQQQPFEVLMALLERPGEVVGSLRSLRFKLLPFVRGSKLLTAKDAKAAKSDHSRKK